MLPHDLRLFVINHASLKPWFGSRVSPPPVPRNPTFPYLTFQQIAYDGRHTLVGFEGHASALYQLEVFAATEDAATRAARALRVVLNGYRGTWGETTVRGVFLQTQFEDDIPPESGQEKPMYRVTQDYAVWHLDT